MTNITATKICSTSRLYQCQHCVRHMKRLWQCAYYARVQLFFIRSSIVVSSAHFEYKVAQFNHKYSQYWLRGNSRGTSNGMPVVILDISFAVTLLFHTRTKPIDISLFNIWLVTMSRESHWHQYAIYIVWDLGDGTCATYSWDNLTKRDSLLHCTNRMFRDWEHPWPAIFRKRKTIGAINNIHYLWWSLLEIHIQMSFWSYRCC